jgi:hypothetical protein
MKGGTVMEDKNKMIKLSGIKRTRPTLSCIRHQVEKWIEREQSLLFLPKLSQYDVTLTHDPDSMTYTCQIQVTIGSKKWFGVDTAKSLQESIARALRHMVADPLIRLPRVYSSHAPMSEIVA